MAGIRKIRLFVLMVLCLATPFAHKDFAMADTIRKEIVYADVDGRKLLLDLYVPHAGSGGHPPAPVPVIVWVHGGAWRSGSRSDVPIRGLIQRGFAIASVDYRLSTVARFPAQVHDIRAAIRFLRRNSSDLRLDASRFALGGVSAGGHLAALSGLSDQKSELEGRVGDALDESSEVHAIVSFFGASNFQTILSQSTPHGLSVRVPALELLLGGQPAALPDLARLASPVAHVNLQSPPLLLIHGDEDPQMPVDQSYELQMAYDRAGVPVQLTVIPGGRHGGPEFFSDSRLDEVTVFLQRHLKMSQDQR